MTLPTLRLKSLKSNGIRDDDVTIEALKSRGLQQIQLTGLPDVWLRDTREKIRALVSNFVPWGPLDRILIHLLPAGVEKCGPHLELPIALASMCVLQNNLPENTLKILADNYFVGALNLRGEILPTAETQAWEKLSSGSVIGPSRYTTLQELWTDLMSGEVKAPPSILSKNNSSGKEQEVFWQPRQRRAEQFWIWISYLARLPVLLLGPPGVGKSYLAKWSEQFLFYRSPHDEVNVRRLWSLAHLPEPERPPVLNPMPRAHLSEFVGMQRHGIPRPGYFALAHNGMLVLDEFCEFSRDCREILRNILDEKKILQNTKSGQAQWPANFFLILTSNPCPCGLSRPGDLSRCRCPGPTLQKYQARISGPLFDRMGVRLFLSESPEVTPLPPEYLKIPTRLVEVRESIEKVETQWPQHWDGCLEAVYQNPRLKKLSQRDQVNKAKLLAVLKILTGLDHPPLLVALEKKSRDEHTILEQNQKGGGACYPFGAALAAEE